MPLFQCFLIPRSGLGRAAAASLQVARLLVLALPLSTLADPLVPGGRPVFQPFADGPPASARADRPATAATAATARLPGSFTRCAGFFPAGQPPAVRGRPQLRELCFDSFALLHSGQSRTAVYTAQRLNKQALGGQKRDKSDRFFADARLPRGERAELEDYKRSGYSRGHLAPAGDMATPEAMAQSFSLANMVPQSIRHNGGAWAKVEQDTRKYVQRARGDVYVITAPVFQPGAERIGPNGVAVPSHLFKLVYDSVTRQAWAHWQANRDDERASRPISYDELVRRTGVQWLPPGAVAR